MILSILMLWIVTDIVSCSAFALGGEQQMSVMIVRLNLNTEAVYG